MKCKDCGQDITYGHHNHFKEYGTTQHKDSCKTCNQMRYVAQKQIDDNALYERVKESYRNRW